MSMLTPQQVANFFLSKRNHDIDNLKLNKLLFISLGCGLAVSNLVLFSEDVQAWALGPIVPSIYHEFKHCDRKTIKEKSIIVDFKGGKFVDLEPYIEDCNDTSESDKKYLIMLLDKVWEVYGKHTPLELVNITHRSGSPWSQTYGNKSQSVIIKRDMIKEYYERVFE